MRFRSKERDLACVPPPPPTSPQNRAGDDCTQTKKDREKGFSVLVPQKMERAPFLARFSHGNAFKLLRHGEPQMSSPPISISHRLFRCRLQALLSFPAPPPERPGELAHRLINEVTHLVSGHLIAHRSYLFGALSFLFSLSFPLFISLCFFSAFCCCKLRNYA